MSAVLVDRAVSAPWTPENAAALVRLVQTRTAAELQRFFVSPWSPATIALPPALRRVRPLFHAVRPLVDRIHAESGLLSEMHALLDGRVQTRTEACRVFSAWARESEGAWKLDTSPRSPRRIPTRPLSIGADRSREALDFIRREATSRKVRSALLDVQIIGSYGDGRYKLGWSDLDLVAILRAEAMSDPSALAAAHRAFARLAAAPWLVHPLQLHGPFVLAEQDLAHHPDALLPLALLGESGSVLEPGEIRAAARPSSLEARQAFDAEVRGRYENLRQTMVRGMSLRDRVLFLHVVYLFPAQLLGVIERPTTKRASFQRIREVLSAESVRFLDDASAVFHEWREDPFPWAGALAPLTKIAPSLSPRVASKLGARASAPALEVVPALVPRFAEVLEEATRLVDAKGGAFA